MVSGGANGSIAIGKDARVETGVTNAVALGAGSVATQSNTVSVGEKRIVNVAAGTAATDAVNKGQLDAVNAQFTNGNVAASFNSLNASGAATVGSLNAGSGSIQTSGAISGGTLATTGNATVGGALSAWGANFNGKVVTNVGAGTAGTDAVNKGQLDAAIAGVSATAAGDATVALAAAQAAQATADNSAQYADAGQTLGLKANGGAGTRITNVAAGVNAADAVNKGQFDVEVGKLRGEIADVTAAAGGDAAVALSAAQAAQATADTALSAAGTAQVTADNALSAAGTAQVIADNALSAAGTAQATADNALSVAANSAQYADGGRTLDLKDNGGAGTRVANVAAGAVAMDAVNFGQLQAVMTQLIRSGMCRVSGASVRCGAAAAADAVQMGTGAAVADGADNAVAIGRNASAQSAGGVAVGDGATAVMANSVAIGKGATAHSSVAVGTGAQALGTNTTAVGDDAAATGNFAVALGNKAQAAHDNAVALGNGSVTAAADTVSVGAPGAGRRITHVAAPVEAGDAATKGYVDALGERAGAYTDRRVSAARDYAARGIAATAAMVGVTPSAVGKTAIGIGTGHYDGHNALGLSIAHALRANVLLSAGVAASNGGTAVFRTGAAFEF